MIKVRIMICFLILSLCACKEAKKEIKETKEITPKGVEDKVQSASNDQLSDFVGEYEFKDPDNPEENLLLVLKTADIKSIADFEGYAWEEKNEKGEVAEKTLVGLFYGNTDLFDQAREGYEPGFFVANVQIEPAGENSLQVNIRAAASDILENPVPPTIKSTKEALEKGNKKWEITEIDIFRELIFEIKNPKKLILKSDLGLEDKTFKKVK
ncbi:hypothetical protein J2Y38_002338 [Flavobacterium sp. 2755]|uniref:hypothetical protein n=1 Tax=Flavobacterium sp. 2755 TaxID=2817765 RepID=UPI00286130E1|nr:hypothetical protein [Flavobacterium sp. 2755]MDR6762127.1 hypothetical protein [Flavobacterium sp. 2755]